MVTNLSHEILEAAKLLKEEQDLIGSTEAVAEGAASLSASVISDWLYEELEEIEWNYQHSSLLQRKIFNLEMNIETLTT